MKQSLLYKTKALLYDLYQTYQYSRSKTKLYHQGKAKSGSAVIKELLEWRLKEREFNSMYYAFGLNLAGTDQAEYIGRREFLKVKERVEQKLKQKHDTLSLNYDVICKDKFVVS